MAQMEHKCGDTFDYVATIPSTFPDGHFAGWNVSAHVRNALSGVLIAELDVSWVDPDTTRTLRLLKIDTSAWAPCQALFDIQFTRTSDGYKLSTATKELTLLKDVTRP